MGLPLLEQHPYTRGVGFAITQEHHQIEQAVAIDILGLEHRAPVFLPGRCALRVVRGNTVQGAEIHPLEPRIPAEVQIGGRLWSATFERRGLAGRDQVRQPVTIDIRDVKALSPELGVDHRPQVERLGRQKPGAGVVADGRLGASHHQKVEQLIPIEVDERLSAHGAHRQCRFGRNGACLRASDSGVLPRLVGVNQALARSFIGRMKGRVQLASAIAVEVVNRAKRPNR